MTYSFVDVDPYNYEEASSEKVLWYAIMVDEYNSMMNNDLQEILLCDQKGSY